MADNSLPLQTLEQVCLHLNVERQELDAFLASIPRQYQTYTKRSRSGKERRIYNPRPTLRSVQAPLQHLLSQIPVSDAAHGWRTRRSPTTNARPHVGQQVVMKMDLEDLYPNCHYQRVHALFLQLGCSEEVATVLTQVTTADHHLPQGFLTSPTIANLLLETMDRRLAGLSKQRGAAYTRYGDDLAYSGPQPVLRMAPLARRIIGEAGFKVNAAKFAEGGVRHDTQRQEICAITVNEKLNLCKPDYRHYRDLIHRCVLHGPVVERQNGETVEHMRARLLGYINYVRGINRQSARRLQGEYDQIVWTWAVVED